MEYKGYSARVEYDEDLGVLHGQVLNINDVITFQATSVDELRKEFEISVDDYLAWCEERGEEPDRPFSGRFLLRVDPDLHRGAALAAAKAGKSLTAWVTTAIEAALNGHEPAPALLAQIEEAVSTSVRKHTMIRLSDQMPLQGSMTFGTVRTISPGEPRAAKHQASALVRPSSEVWTDELN